MSLRTYVQTLQRFGGGMLTGSFPPPSSGYVDSLPTDVKLGSRTEEGQAMIEATVYLDTKKCGLGAVK